MARDTRDAQERYAEEFSFLKGLEGAIKDRPKWRLRQRFGISRSRAQKIVRAYFAAGRRGLLAMAAELLGGGEAR